jgi:hypothetical protein
MNLFLLSEDPDECAEQHCDKHVVKMPVELTQMLYTAHHVNNSSETMEIFKLKAPEKGWKQVFTNHPMSIWVRGTREAYEFTCLLGIALCEEYTYRYDREHACEKHLRWLEESHPEDFPKNLKDTFNVCRTPPTLVETPFKYFPLCMPIEYKTDDAILSYHQYYIGDKKRFATWKRRTPPLWW